MPRFLGALAAAAFVLSGCTIETIKYRDRPVDDAGATAMDAGMTDSGGRDSGALDAGADGGGDGDAGPCGVCAPGSYCSATAGCVSCLTNDQCPSRSAPACTDSACQGCRSDADCSRFVDAPACRAGECVACSATNHGVCDASRACDVRAGTCSSWPTGSSTVCEYCVSDAQCQPGQLCAPSSSLSATYGPVCLWRIDAGLPGAPSGDCDSSAPFGLPFPIRSLDGVNATVCALEYATCRTLTRYGLSCVDATTCGDSGHCVASRCTYSCNVPHACPEDRACSGDCAL